VKISQSIGIKLQKRKELLYNLGAISSYTSMLNFFGMASSSCRPNSSPSTHLFCMPRLHYFQFL
jgi:hypothetical protein